MGITVISEDNLHEYMQILTSDEIFGINEDTLTSFVISDDEKNEPAGVPGYHKRQARDAIEASRKAFTA